MISDSAAYLVEILQDDLGLDDAEAIETLTEAIIHIAQQSDSTNELLENAANILADA
jgi:urease gamma subunit